MEGGSAVERGHIWLLAPSLVAGVVIGALVVMLWIDRDEPVIVVQPLPTAAATHTVFPELAPLAVAAESPEPATPLDLNSATEGQLADLPGIGPSIAREIVADRERRGPFLSVDDLARVRGISPTMVDALRDRVVVTP